MKSSMKVAALALTFLHGAMATNNAFSRSFALLADMGLNPDGTPMADSSSARDAFSISSVKEAMVGSVSSMALEEIKEEYVELPVDNFHDSKNQPATWQGTFNNRYWVSQRAYKTGGPVFIYDVGEANAQPNALFRLQNETSFFRQLVEKYNGIGIVWEHRFYGNSSPTPVDIHSPAEDFEFLTTEQSLADVDRFARQFSRANINQTLTPDKTPWIFVGGSYPAMRAAFMRNQYPDTIYASWASSAPVQASVDQSFYFEPVWRGLNAYGFGNCSRDIQAAVRYMDHIMDTNKTAAAAIKIQLLGLGAEKNSHATFADALATIFATWQSYGVEGGAQGLRRFCDWIETDTDGMMPKVAGGEGHAKTKGPKWVVDRWASFPLFAGNVNKYLETECSGKNNVVGNCDLNRQFTDPAMISWTWQYCTQWGYFQSANLGPQQLVSKYNSLVHQKDICHRQFPDAPRSLFPEWPNVDRTNRVFGGWSIRPSNTYWSNGEFDPWRTLSPSSAEPFAPRVRTSANAPRCGESTAPWEVFGYVIPNAQHCYDFRTVGTTAPGGVTSRDYFHNALTGWLKCWKPKRKPEKPGYPTYGGGRPWKG
ncbi:serine carboxypeptidase S28-domain-containing protein [Phaeosphaeriaceae sp. PMI808]|nr:serine carboxypeptidase S28-domain-containing protein [Phaeosphaeriaceae sp. PMI808]